MKTKERLYRSCVAHLAIHLYIFVSSDFNMVNFGHYLEHLLVEEAEVPGENH